MSKKREKQAEAKRAAKASRVANFIPNDKKPGGKLNPNVPYQRRRLARMRGAPISGRTIQPWWSSTTMTGLGIMFVQDKMSWKERMKAQYDEAYQGRKKEFKKAWNDPRKPTEGTA